MPKILLRSACAVLFFAFLFAEWDARPPELQVSDETGEPGSTRLKATSRKTRAPASVREKKGFAITHAERIAALEEVHDFMPQDSSESAAPTSGGYQPMDTPMQRESYTLTEKVAAAKGRAAEEQTGEVRTFSNQGFPVIGADVPATTSTVPTKKSGSSKTESQEQLNCTASLGGGSFSSPRSVSLSCTGAAEIRYCVQEGSCCDPDGGTLYTGSFLLGSTAGDFCLSFKGENDEAAITSVTEQLNYQFIPGVPHLLVEHQRRYWQTGQLSARLSFVSDNFGSPQLEAGIVNLLTHDPSPSGLNMSCEQIVDNYTTLTTPSPLVVMPGMAVDNLNPNTRLNAWFTSAELSYGLNHVTTYLKNTNYGSESFACTTARLVLNDFEYFSTEAPETVTTISADSELMGGLSTYGHFEEDAALNRTPAGSMVNTKQEQELRAGMVGIFF